MAIRLHELKVCFRDPRGQERPVLDIDSLEVADGDQICLVGHSGSGKTTLLNCLAGIVVPTSGRIEYDDVDIARLSESARDRFRAQHIGYVFQTFNLFRHLTCAENVALQGTLCGACGSDVDTRVQELLGRVGLEDRLSARPGELSVGEQQRVAIARALLNRPKVVLADEPTANLDEEASDVVLDLLREVAAEQGSILVLVTHEARVKDRFENVRPLSGMCR